MTIGYYNVNNKQYRLNDLHKFKGEWKIKKIGKSENWGRLREKKQK